MSLWEWAQSMHFFSFFKKIFIWLCWVLVVAHDIFSCGIWDLVPSPGTEPWPLHWELSVLTTGPPGKSQASKSFFLMLMASREGLHRERSNKQGGMLAFPAGLSCISFGHTGAGAVGGRNGAYTWVKYFWEPPHKSKMEHQWHIVGPTQQRVLLLTFLLFLFHCFLSLSLLPEIPLPNNLPAGKALFGGGVG